MITRSHPRVLHVLVPQREGAIGGADLHVLDLATQQQRTGWAPAIWSPRAPESYRVLLRTAGLEVIDAPLNRPLDLARLAGKLDVDVVHAHGYESNYLVATLRLLVPEWRRLPMVVTAHGWIETTVQLRMKSALDRLAARMAHARIASASAHVGRLPSRFGVNFVVHNGVQPPPATRRAGASPDRSKPLVIGSVGRLSPEKRVDLLLTAAAKLITAGTDLKLLIVGGGDQRGPLEQLVSQLGIADRVSFTGLVADTDPPYSRMSMLVQASDTEGTPRTVIEAMARRLPIVATDVGDVAELLDNGRCGVLVPAGDVEALAAAIERLGSDLNLADQLARAAETRFQEHFTIEIMERNVARCYEAAIKLANHEKKEMSL